MMMIAVEDVDVGSGCKVQVAMGRAANC